MELKSKEDLQANKTDSEDSIIISIEDLPGIQGRGELMSDSPGDQNDSNVGG